MSSEIHLSLCQLTRLNQVDHPPGQGSVSEVFDLLARCPGALVRQFNFSDHSSLDHPRQATGCSFTDLREHLVAVRRINRWL
jgi:hypothetical protein